MTGGEWLIRQHPPNGLGGYLTERVTIETDTAGGTQPTAYVGEAGLSFTYLDGRYIIYPWANIVSAEYRPHPEP
jgi:hypothetical protein